MYTIMKRLLDVVIALGGMLLSLPIFLVVALLVRIRLGQPILFRQERPGMNEIPFKIIKFRTMRDTVGPDGTLLSDADRLTRLGRVLRSWSLDEMPELLNVLKGDMSIVGPRPLLMEYLPLYSQDQKRRHDVRPGLTGWAQVNGRNNIDWSERFTLDVWYVDNRSILLDLKIVIKTIVQLLAREGISHGGHATMPRFRGD